MKASTFRIIVGVGARNVAAVGVGISGEGAANADGICMQNNKAIDRATSSFFITEPPVIAYVCTYRLLGND